MQLLNGRGGIIYNHLTELMTGRHIFVMALVGLRALDRADYRPIFFVERAVRRTTSGGLFSRSPNPPERVMCRRYDPLSSSSAGGLVLLCMYGTIDELPGLAPLIHGSPCYLVLAR